MMMMRQALTWHDLVFDVGSQSELHTEVLCVEESKSSHPAEIDDTTRSGDWIK